MLLLGFFVHLRRSSECTNEIYIQPGHLLHDSIDSASQKDANQNSISHRYKADSKEHSIRAGIPTISKPIL